MSSNNGTRENAMTGFIEGYIVECTKEKGFPFIWFDRDYDFVKISKDRYTWSIVDTDYILDFFKHEDGYSVYYIKDNLEHEDASDPVNHPSHYMLPGLNIEVIDVLKVRATPEEWRGYLKLTAMAYLLRAGYKDEILQDVKKCNKYLEWLEEALEE